MTLVFSNPLGLSAIAGAASAVNTIAANGGTTWFQDVLLVGIYVLLRLAFFFVVPAGEQGLCADEK